MTGHFPDPKITEDLLHAYVDRLLPENQRAAVERHLQTAPDDAVRVADWQSQNRAMQELFPRDEAEARLRDLPLPTARLTRYWPRIAASAALLAIGLAGGWILRGPGPGLPLEMASLDALEQQARNAHLIYSVEVLHPVEVTVEDEVHLVTWLSNRLGAPLAAPNLSAQGYELIGGRLLPASDGPAAQLMYQDRSGARVTVFLTAGAVGVLASFRFSDEGAVASVAWEDERFGYAVVGDLDRDGLMALATEIYRQFL
jgi:anti-sigma factor RsiW